MNIPSAGVIRRISLSTRAVYCGRTTSKRGAFVLSPRTIRTLTTASTRNSRIKGISAVEESKTWIGGIRYRFFATTDSERSEDDEVFHKVKGAQASEDAYFQYLETKEELEALQKNQEHLKSKKMYEAWCQTVEKQKKKDDSKKNLAAGVAVVRTLAKESRKKTVDDNIMVLSERAEVQLQRAAHVFEHPSALVELGNRIIEEDDANQETLQKAIEYYRRAGEKGLAEGWFNLATCLFTGIPQNGEPKLLLADRAAAMEAFRKAIALGDIDSMYIVGVNQLGQMDCNDELTPGPESERVLKELDEGKNLIEQAAAGGHGGALYYLALFHMNGHRALQIPPGSKEDFVKLLDKAVEHDKSGDAHFVRASCYLHGESGYPEDVQKALMDYLKASDAGHGDAAVSAGAILHKGVPGVIKQDQRRAFELYQHAGELGCIEGWRNVAACYAKGEGVARSVETAEYIAKTMLNDQN